MGLIQMRSLDMAMAHGFSMESGQCPHLRILSAFLKLEGKASRAHVQVVQRVKGENFGSRFEAIESAKQAVGHRIHSVFEGN